MCRAHVAHVSAQGQVHCLTNSHTANNGTVSKQASAAICMDSKKLSTEIILVILDTFSSVPVT